jgi:galactokinase
MNTYDTMEPRPVDATIASDLRKGFRELYGEPARVYRAPGRVNLIGEHTDYNDGFVMPVAIDLCVWVAIAPRVDRKLLVRSINFPDTAEVDLEAKVPHARNHWSDYVQGVAVILTRAGCRLQGANLLIRGDVPIGAGLSSSAAIEVATALALLDNSKLVTDRVELAELCRSAENEFVGARVGIMDQFVSCCAQAGQALFLDCRSLEYWLVPLPPNVSLVTCNTMVKHRHASGEYNTRRAQCEEGVRLLSRSLPNIRALRDVTAEELERHGHDLPETIRKRCRHVILENARVSAASTALQDGDLVTFGRLMKESHRSLRGDYEVSCPELDVMVELAEKQEGVYGARMTGGDFGGCTVNLVKSDAAAQFEKSVSVAYEKATGLSPQILVTSAAAGVGEVEA